MAVSPAHFQVGFDRGRANGHLQLAHELTVGYLLGDARQCMPFSRVSFLGLTVFVLEVISPLTVEWALGCLQGHGASKEKGNHSCFLLSSNRLSEIKRHTIACFALANSPSTLFRARTYANAACGAAIDPASPCLH